MAFLSWSLSITSANAAWTIENSLMWKRTEFARRCDERPLHRHRQWRVAVFGFHLGFDCRQNRQPATNEQVDIDSRPSDALALAVRSGAPIFAAEDVIAESAIEFEHEVEDTEEVVEKFKDFLDHVTPEDFAGE